MSQMELNCATPHSDPEALGLKSKQYALYLGRFSPEKNCHLLIEAFERLETSMKLVLAGGSSHTDEYVARLRQRQSDRIKILDWVSGDALEQLLTNAALFVLSSEMEGMSLALLDAMGAGVCVLASDIPENVEAIADAGFVFKRGDAQDLRKMLQLLLSNSAMRYDAGRRGQERVRQHYLWDSVAESTASVYLSLMGKRGLALPAQRKAIGKAA
jgi:glycosyltransferase involved in cell wall biosynthesis